MVEFCISKCKALSCVSAKTLRSTTLVPFVNFHLFRLSSLCCVCRGKAALHFACGEGHLEIVRMLLKARVSVGPASLASACILVEISRFERAIKLMVDEWTSRKILCIILVQLLFPFGCAPSPIC